MKRTALALCIVMSMATAANAACYKCVTDKGVVLFTDSPPQNAKCEWLSNCTSTYSEELERENEARDAISRSQWEEEEARKSALKQQELEARQLELKQEELELKQRELDQMADQALKENYSEGYNSIIPYGNRIKRKHDHRHPSPPKSKLKENKPHPKAPKDSNPKDNAAGRIGGHPDTKITNEKRAVKVRQSPSGQPSLPEKN